MDALTIARVDERDSSWENPRPRFRVCLHGSGADSTQGPTDTFDIIGADVLQTIEWAQRQAGDTLTYAVALVYDVAAEQPNPGPWSRTGVARRNGRQRHPLQRHGGRPSTPDAPQTRHPRHDSDRRSDADPCA